MYVEVVLELEVLQKRKQVEDHSAVVLLAVKGADKVCHMCVSALS